MATKVIRTCDRLGCAIDTNPFVPGEELPSYGTVGYTVLKTVTDESGKTTTTQLADFDEVCADCSEAIEDLVLRIKGEKRAGRPRKVDTAASGTTTAVAETAAPEKTRKKPGPKPGSKRRGRRTNAQIAADKAAAEAAAAKGGDEPVEIPATVDPDAADVLKQAAEAVRKGASALPPEPEADETDTFETDSGEIVNADTGEILAMPVEGEDSEDASVQVFENTPANGSSMGHAHPF